MAICAYGLDPWGHEASAAEEWKIDALEIYRGLEKGFEASMEL